MFPGRTKWFELIDLRKTHHGGHRGHRGSTKILQRQEIETQRAQGNSQRDAKSQRGTCLIASAILTVSTATFTSWTRTMWAPRRMAAVMLAMVPWRRSVAGVGSPFS